MKEGKRMDVELHHAEKLESVGRLAAGIAHEINTPIQFVGDNLQFMQDSLADLLALSDRHVELLEKIKTDSVSDELISEQEQAFIEADIEYLREELPAAIEQSLEGTGRVAGIVRAMKEFAHPGSSEMVDGDINEAIRTTITVSRNEWKYVAEMETDLDPGLPLVPCLLNEFNQVILNMIVNARDAISDSLGDDDSPRGTITILTSQKNGFAEITVSDTGAGMPDEVRKRIFDPFFTTKERGKGSGQGLSIAHDVIVDKHNGELAVESEPGEGTTFLIRLPLENETVEDFSDGI